MPDIPGDGIEFSIWIKELALGRHQNSYLTFEVGGWLQNTRKGRSTVESSVGSYRNFLCFYFLHELRSKIICLGTEWRESYGFKKSVKGMKHPSWEERNKLTKEIKEFLAPLEVIGQNLKWIKPVWLCVSLQHASKEFNKSCNLATWVEQMKWNVAN